MSDEREKWAEIGVASQQAVDAVRELGHLLRQLADSWSSSVAKAAADQMEPATATSPPEPEWEPGQVVRLRLEDGMPYLAKRVDSNDGWEVFGVDVVIPDAEVTDVEPVVVLTAEDARDLGEGQVGIGSFERFFRERGLDL